MATEQFPPSPQETPSPAAALATAKTALSQGDNNRAFTLLCAAQAGSEDKWEWILTMGLAEAALGRPLHAAKRYSDVKEINPRALPLSVAAAKRLLPASASAMRTDAFRWPGLTAERLSQAVAIQPGADGGLLLLLEDRLVLLGADGKERATQSLPGAQDLTLDSEGLPLALGLGKLFRANRVIPLPAGLQSAVSAAATPDGRILVLDAKAGALVVLDSDGALKDRKPLGLGEPGKVRVDLAGRVFVTDRRDRSVAVLRGSDLSSLRIIHSPVAPAPLKRLDNLAVDPFGCLLLLDAKRGQVMLLSPDGNLLAEANRDGLEPAALGWDGLDTLLYLDKRAGVVGRLAW